MGLTSLFARNCCAQPPRPFGKRTIILDGFGFSTLITDIFPNRLTSARAEPLILIMFTGLTTH